MNKWKDFQIEMILFHKNNEWLPFLLDLFIIIIFFKSLKKSTRLRLQTYKLQNTLTHP
jgi:hypothetical protein